MAVVNTIRLLTSTCKVVKVANLVQNTLCDEIAAAADGWTEMQVLWGTINVDSTGATVDIVVSGLPETGSSLVTLVPAMAANELRAKYTKSGAVKEAGRTRTLPPYVKVGFISDATLDADVFVVLTRPAMASVA